MQYSSQILMQAGKRVVKTPATLVAASILVLLCLSQPAAAASAWEPSLAPNSLAPTASSTAAPGSALGAASVERAIRIVRRETGARVLAAEPGQRRGSPGVNVRILKDGARVSTLFVKSDGTILQR